MEDISNIETDILHGLLNDEKFTRTSLPHLSGEYFSDPANRVILDVITKHFELYKVQPSKIEVCATIRDLTGKIKDDLVATAGVRVARMGDEKLNTEWLTNRAEKFCKDRAMYNAVALAAAITAGEVKDKNMTFDAIPDIMRDALSVSFETRLGHDYFLDAAKRWDYYTETTPRLKFRIRQFNEITRGGLPRKTLTVPVAGTNVGKSFLLCNWAADFLKDGYNVLYISNEMSEEMLGERVDANMLGVTIDELPTLGWEYFNSQVNKAKTKTAGTLKFREYPTRSASVKHFRKLLKDLADKEGFVPDIVMVDYLNNCLPATVRNDANSYERNKAIAEELRGMAVEFNVAVIAPTQTNRQGQNNSDVSLEEISESHGVSMTADLMFALIRTEHLRESNQILVKQLKNRLGNMGWYPKFIIGADFPRMTLFESDDQGGAGFGGEDKPVFDKSPAGIRINEQESVPWN